MIDVKAVRFNILLKNYTRNHAQTLDRVLSAAIFNKEREREREENERNARVEASTNGQRTL